jgi:ribosomal protein S18 acetylase RimI-like enzyme
MQEVSVRVAEAADVPKVLELWHEARSPLARTEDTQEALERLRSHTEDALLVAELEGELVGALVAAWDGWRGNMYRLAVAPRHRRLGIGLRLVEAAHDMLRKKGARRVTVLVGHDEAAAVALWEAAGYEHDELMARFVRNL